MMPETLSGHAISRVTARGITWVLSLTPVNLLRPEGG